MPLSEQDSLRARIDRVFSFLPFHVANARASRAAKLAAKTTTTRTGRIAKSDQETLSLPAIQLSFLWYGKADQAEDQGKTG